MTEDEMVGWHHQLSGHKFEQTLADSEGQGSLVCCSPRDREESDTTERLNNNKCVCVCACMCVRACACMCMCACVCVCSVHCGCCKELRMLPSDLGIMINLSCFKSLLQMSSH